MYKARRGDPGNVASLAPPTGAIRLPTNRRECTSLRPFSQWVRGPHAGSAKTHRFGPARRGPQTRAVSESGPRAGPGVRCRDGTGQSRLGREGIGPGAVPRTSVEPRGPTARMAHRPEPRATGSGTSHSIAGQPRHRSRPGVAFRPTQTHPRRVSPGSVACEFTPGVRRERGGYTAPRRGDANSRNRIPTDRDRPIRPSEDSCPQATRAGESRSAPVPSRP